jgi:hypothetical protein
MIALVQSLIVHAKSALRPGRLTYALSICVTILREVFDENAYHRFLTRQNLISSREAFANFQSEQASTQRRRHRCC